jgi:hypothetical protein
MRTYKRLVFGTLLGLTLVFTSVVISAHAEPLGARIISVHGLVEVQGGSPGLWVSAGAPAMLPPGAALRTGPKAQAVLELDGSVITLYETSLIRIPAVASQASTSPRPLRHPALDRGRAVFDVTPTPDHVPFSVKTPTIVAGVKGTVFEVVATGTQEAVYVWSGLVEVSSRINPDDVELVAAGQFTALDQLRLTLPSDIPFERQAPSGLENHPDAGHDRGHQVKESTPPVSGMLPVVARPDILPADEHSVVDSLPVSPDNDVLGADIDHPGKFWEAADETAVQNALDRALEIQTVVSTGSLNAPASSKAAGVRNNGSNGNNGSGSVATDADDLVSDLADVVSSTIDSLAGLGL